MHHSLRELTRKQAFKCCSSVARFWCLGLTNLGKGRYSDSCHLHIRNYSGQVAPEPIGRHTSLKDQVVYLPSRRELSSLGRSLVSESGESNSIFQRECFKHPFKNWQEERRHKLTASTFGGAVGFWPRRRVQLWLEKIGARKPFLGNEATSWNNIKEQEAVEWYREITGNFVSFPKFQIYRENCQDDAWLAASPDGVIDSPIYDLPSRGILEVKCPLPKGEMSQATPWKRIPLYYIPQAQGLMEILDRDWMDFYVWMPVGSSLFRIHRDKEYWAALKLALSDFWLKHVVPARDICNKNVITNPLTQLHSLKPEPKHELCSYIVWESKRIANNSQLLLREIRGKLQN